MAAAPDEPLAATRLCDWERMAVALAVTHHGEDAPALLRPLAPPAGPRCAAAAVALLALPASARAPLLAQETARLSALVPPGLERVHPSWLAAALQPLPPGAQVALGRALPPRDDETGAVPGDALGPAGALAPATLAWLARVALGGLCPLPPAAGTPADLADGARGPAALLLETVRHAGRERVALALRHAPRSALAALCARLPAAEAAALVRAVAAAPPAPTGARQALDALAAAAAHASGAGLELVDCVGARAVGAAVAGAGDAPRQLAQLLPRDLGQQLLAAAHHAARGGAAPAAPDPASLPAPGEQVD